MRYHFLRKSEQALLRALAEVVVPRWPEDAGVDFGRRLLYHNDRFLAQLPRLLGASFHVGALFFNWLPVVATLRFRPFTRLDFAARRRWLERAGNSRFSPLYRWFSVVRGLILLVYYSQGSAQSELGLEPGKWAKQQVLQRRWQLHLTDEAPHDSQRPHYQP